MFRPGALRWLATIGVGEKQVQLPTGFAYQAGDEVELNQRQVEQLDPKALSEGIIELEPKTPFHVAGQAYWLVVADSFDITGNDNDIDLDASGELQLGAEVSFDGVSAAYEVPASEVSWTSDDEGVATVDGDGLVTGVTVGTANVTATWGTYTDTVEVTVVDTGA